MLRDYGRFNAIDSMNRLLQLDLCCPGCQQWVRSSIWDSLLGRAECTQCGPLREATRIESHEQATRILLAPDSLPRSFLSVVMYIALAAAGLFVFLVITAGWSGVSASLVMLVMAVLVFVFMVRQSGFAALGLSGCYLFSKEIVLDGTTITVRMLSPKCDRTVDIDCSPEHKPCVSIKGNAWALPIIQINTLDKQVCFGSGLAPDVAGRLVGILQDFVKAVADDAAGVSAPVADIAQKLETEGTVCLEDKPHSGPERRIEIVDHGSVLILNSSALWDVRKWLVFLGIVGGVVAVFCWLWHLGYKLGFAITIGAGAVAYLMDITVEIRPSTATIVYRVFKSISWKREVAVEQIIDVDNKWTGSCAIITPGRSYRISHLSSPKAREELAALVKMYLAQRAGWQPTTRLSVQMSNGIPHRLTLPPSGVRAFDELGFNLGGLIFLSILFVPLVCFIELIPLFAFVPAALEDLDAILRITVPVHALVLLYLIVRLAKAPVNIDVQGQQTGREAGITTGDVSKKPILTIRRCMWNGRGIAHRFVLDEQPIVVAVERDSRDEKAAVGIAQGKKKIGVGSSLSWQDQQQLKTYIDQMLSASNRDANE